MDTLVNKLLISVIFLCFFGAGISIALDYRLHFVLLLGLAVVISIFLGDEEKKNKYEYDY